MKQRVQNAKILCLLCLSIALIVGLALSCMSSIQTLGQT
jgi:hypothetical protein